MALTSPAYVPVPAEVAPADAASEPKYLMLLSVTAPVELFALTPTNATEPALESHPDGPRF